MTDPAPSTLLSIAPLLIMALFGLIFAFGNYFLARRLRRNPLMWAVLSVIPVVNIAFAYYIMYVVIFALLDRLTWIRERVEARV